MIKFGSKVKMHYSISNTEGVEFESTYNKKPIIFNIGDGLIPQKLEIPLYGLMINDEQTTQLDPSNAFGIIDDKKIKIIKKNEFPNQNMIKLGNVLEFDIKTKEGIKNTILGSIKAINGENITVDLNHPLAGFKIILKVKILEVS